MTASGCSAAAGSSGQPERQSGSRYADRANIAGLSDRCCRNCFVERCDRRNIHPAKQIVTLHKRGDSNLITSLQGATFNHDPEIQMSVVKIEDNMIGAFVENWQYIVLCGGIRRVARAIRFQAEAPNDNIAELQKPA
jgi:hypothetical protein